MPECQVVRFCASYDAARGTLVLRGDLDGDAPEMVRVAVAEHSHEHTDDLRVDLTQVTYLPSSVLGILAVARRDAGRRDARLDLIAEPASIAHRVLSVAGLRPAAA